MSQYVLHKAIWIWISCEYLSFRCNEKGSQRCEQCLWFNEVECSFGCQCQVHGFKALTSCRILLSFWRGRRIAWWLGQQCLTWSLWSLFCLLANRWSHDHGWTSSCSSHFTHCCILFMFLMELDRAWRSDKWSSFDSFESRLSDMSWFQLWGRCLFGTACIGPYIWSVVHCWMKYHVFQCPGDDSGCYRCELQNASFMQFF